MPLDYENPERATRSPYKKFRAGWGSPSFRERVLMYGEEGAIQKEEEREAEKVRVTKLVREGKASSSFEVPDGDGFCQQLWETWRDASH